MSYIVQNMTSSVVTFILYKDDAGMAQMAMWQAKRQARNNRVYVKIPPNLRADLEADYGMTEAELRAQPELLSMLARGHIQRVVDEAFVEPKPILTAEDINKHIAANRKTQPHTVLPETSHIVGSWVPEPVGDDSGVVVKSVSATSDGKVIIESSIPVKTPLLTEDNQLTPAGEKLVGLKPVEEMLTCGCGKSFTKLKGLQTHKNFCKAT